MDHCKIVKDVNRSFISENLSDEKEGAWEASRAPGTNVTLSHQRS